jgi:hypothetical protein
MNFIIFIDILSPERLVKRFSFAALIQQNNMLFCTAMLSDGFATLRH